jgi:hypothetical protein
MSPPALAGGFCLGLGIAIESDARVCYWFCYISLQQLAFLGTIIKRWHHKQMAHVLWQQRCLEVASRLHHVGVVDETRRTYRHHGRNATRLGATQRSATRRCASHHIATQRLSRWGSPAARARLARTVPLNDASVESRQAESGDRATAQAQQSLQDCVMT